ncbi:hypothetical protein ACOKGD_13890 [Microbacterium phosphatis]|uniref:hypothetical protein n=1 Tax=Microbacterium phosphatis TaxID=3140248 RepID=UPI003140AB5C
MSAADAIKKIKDKYGENGASAWLALDELAKEIDRVEREAPRKASEEIARQIRF